MRKKVLYSFLLIISLFAFVFVIASCDNSSNNNDSNSTANSNMSTNPDNSVDSGTSDSSYCLVQFDSKGGSDVPSQNILKGEKASKPSNPKKEGYAFDDWYYQGERWSFIGYTVTENMTLEANWNINSYTLSLSKNNSKAGTISNNSESHNYNESITITATTNLGYTFDGWYDGDNQVYDKEKYTFNMPATNLSYVAKWTANTNTPYKVEHYEGSEEVYISFTDNGNNPRIPFEIDNLTGTTDTLTNAKAKIREGFTSPIVNQLNINGDGTTVVKLYYEKNSYKLNLDNSNVKAGKIEIVEKDPLYYPVYFVNDHGTFNYGEEITIKAETNTGYKFDGWYDGNNRISELESYTFNMPAENITYTAKWSANKHTIILDNQIEGISITGITSGNEYDYDSQITLTANNNTELFVVWTVNGSIEHIGNEYSFKVPDKDLNISITATAANIYTRNSNKIYFGTYPQNIIDDYSLVDELNTLAGELPTASNKYNWIDYNYYILSNVTSYMYYQDIDYDNNGTYDYRGVYITQYRPSYTNMQVIGDTGSTSYQRYNEYELNKIYWFSFDPIEWNILTEVNGKGLVVANLALDSQEFYPSDLNTKFSHNNGTGYANNYELSKIRNFLNDSFYNTAFNDLQKFIIETIIVDNSESSTSSNPNTYICNDTNDKMFLLSYEEVTTYYGNDAARQIKGTDYASLQGLPSDSEGFVIWILRSPGYESNLCCANCILSSGSIYFNVVYATFNGVRPACWITL